MGFKIAIPAPFPGVNVMVTIFGDFSPIFGEKNFCDFLTKLSFFFKINVMIQVDQKLTVF
jgi:hypothetical protein